VVEGDSTFGICSKTLDFHVKEISVNGEDLNDLVVLEPQWEMHHAGGCDMPNIETEKPLGTSFNSGRDLEWCKQACSENLDCGYLVFHTNAYGCAWYSASAVRTCGNPKGRELSGTRDITEAIGSVVYRLRRGISADIIARSKIKRDAIKHVQDQAVSVHSAGCLMEEQIDAYMRTPRPIIHSVSTSAVKTVGVLNDDGSPATQTQLRGIDAARADPTVENLLQPYLSKRYRRSDGDHRFWFGENDINQEIIVDMGEPVHISHAGTSFSISDREVHDFLSVMTANSLAGPWQIFGQIGAQNDEEKEIESSPVQFEGYSYARYIKYSYGEASADQGGLGSAIYRVWMCLKADMFAQGDDVICGVDC
jgi:hypothetical protein